MEMFMLPRGSKLTEKIFCIQCESTSCTHSKVVFKTSLRCEGELVHRVGIHADLYEAKVPQTKAN